LHDAGGLCLANGVGIDAIANYIDV
jgi:hypothetical protein